MSRRICVITSGRADYGLLRRVMQAIKEDPELVLQIIATGMHLSEIFGQTSRDLENDGFSINHRIDLPVDDDSILGVSNTLSIGIKEFAKAYQILNPDLILVLGDRYEIFSATCAALIGKLPVAHLYGGEVTSGAYDEAFRHSITKMSHIPLVATESYRNRVIQLGENPKTVIVVGGLGAENINNIEILRKSELEELLQIKFMNKSLLVTFHPTTLDNESPKEQFNQLLNALSDLKDTTIIFTLPNADTGGIELISMIKEFNNNNPNSSCFSSLGQQVYFSCISQVDGVIGNSSSGLTEVPSFKKATINIGDRQLGRLKSSSIIDCMPNEIHIRHAIKQIYSEEFKKVLNSCINPYELENTSLKIVSILRDSNLKNVIKKRFYDLY